jgi:pimeloyl-ACP methyl ester carboxylesterase
VGDYSLNVANSATKAVKHTIVGLAGLGMGDYSVSARQMTKTLEEDNLVVFVDRAGYGFSDDTNNDMTLEYIVEDYRKALKNAGIKAPYILMPHSIGGAYATYWVSKYPQEIEAIAFVDGSQLSADAFDDEEPKK